MLKRLTYILLFLLVVTNVFATHNRGGEITYVWLGGNTYEFTITTCTDVGPQAQADRDKLYIDYGDGEGDTIFRVQEIPQALDHQKNIYKGIHTFSSAGTMIIKVEDPNRNGGIVNILPGAGDSENVVFELQSTLVISPFVSGGNNSVQFDDCPCPEIACAGFPYCYNPLAYDPDGDSLSYALVAPFKGNGNMLSIPGEYDFPGNIGGGTSSIDPQNGTFCWTNPAQIGEFNFTIEISEWRNGIRIGTVIRDIQLTVDGSCNNTPPTINAPSDICVEAGEEISFSVSASDADGDVLNLQASSLALDLNNSPALFQSTGGSGTANGSFLWNTNCDHIKPGDYTVLFAVTDNGDPEFNAYAQTTITITAPKVTGITASPFGNGVNVGWDPTTCSNAEGYHIYRTSNPSFTEPGCCDNPNPVNYGFTKIGTVFGQPTNMFFDNTSLSLGIDYCYKITAFYEINQVESCPSDTACASLNLDVPIITHVTVNSTDASAGIDSIIWAKPSELDTNQFQGPYHYKIYRGSNIGNVNTLVGQTPNAPLLYQVDTTFTDLGLNTVNSSYYYRIELFYTFNGVEELVGTSNSAESILISTVPNDNEILIKWDEQVPWINEDYIIFRSTSINGTYTAIDTTNNQFYIDTGLVNGTEYCYYIKSRGYYSSTSIINPIENLSQRTCDVPVDLTPPCPPELTINGSCELFQNELIWNNPNNRCADDVMSYNLYFKPTIDSPFELIATFNSNTDTTYTHSNNGSVAGCYYVTAVDSVQYGNESDSSNVVCFDNCPVYNLPNVFTPNGDGNNDLYTALVPYSYVESIEIDIYNRWGQVIFSSTNPDIDWDGKHKDSGTPVPDGVYYYICTVNTIRLSGIEPIVLTGFIQLFNNNGQNSK